ncbi:uncharacterized protein LOC134453293 [Engraulis encrasicolus]|uniref:uncharacterized protein LOC134453293 n=1 Tax=Engraulis encrasicolus TaxID=184585 RepID=UPI002FD528BD
MQNNLKKLKKLEFRVNELYPCAEWQDNVTPLCAAAACGNEEICAYLFTQRADPNIHSTQGLTPLLYAVRCQAKVHLVRQLLHGKADPNLGKTSPILEAICRGRKDIVKQLLKYGAAPDVNYTVYLNPNKALVDQNKLVANMLQELSLEDEQLSKYALFFNITCDVVSKTPQEMYRLYHKDFLEVHPSIHDSLFDRINALLRMHPLADEQMAIEWLKDSHNLNRYIEATIEHLPKVPYAPQQLHVMQSLHLAFRLMEEIPLKISHQIVPTLLQFLKTSQVQNYQNVIVMIYTIMQKTPMQKDGSDAQFVKKLCEGIVPFTKPEHRGLTGVYTYGIISHVHSFLPEIITDLGITSVPERILNAADSQMDDTLKRKVRELNGRLTEQCSKEQTDEGKKQKKKGSTNDVESGSVMGTSDCDFPKSSVQEACSADDGSSVKPFLPVTGTESTSRPWCKLSVRWGEKLENLASMRMTEVKTVKNLTFCDNPDYLIAKGSDGTEVFLGLRDDGTEVAIKRMTKSNYQQLKHEEEFLRLPQLDSPNIVRYVDFAEDGTFGYLVLQLCEYTLEEYIDPKHHQLPDDVPKKMDVLKGKVKEVLHSLQVLHDKNTNVLHRDIKPQNVLIDIRGKARLADFGISRRLNVGQTSLHTSPAGTKCWKSRETLEEECQEEPQNPTKSVYKRSSDIQVTGMLIYYILSCGRHPFGKGGRCEANILDGKYALDWVEDELAKDLIEWMIKAEPSHRPRVEETLTHPYFWTSDRRLEYLAKLGDEKEAEKYRKADEKLLKELDDYTKDKTFYNWKDKFPNVEKLDKKQSEPYPDNTLAMMRFIRNYEHHVAVTNKVDLMGLFPDLFPSLYKFARAKGWNSRPSLEKFFKGPA